MVKYSHMIKSQKAKWDQNRITLKIVQNISKYIIQCNLRIFQERSLIIITLNVKERRLRGRDLTFGSKSV